MNTVLGLTAYLLAAAALTFWTARNHDRLGPVLMRSLFAKKPHLGPPANHLVVVGITVFACSAGALLVGHSDAGGTLTEAIELASLKLGAFCMILNTMHLIRCFNLIRIYERGNYMQRFPRESDATRI